MPDWQRRFDDPIELTGGRKLVTLRDAAEYITGLPKAEHNAAEWEAAMEALLLVAEHDGPTMFARIAMLRALHRGQPEPTPTTRHKRAKAYRIVQGLPDRSMSGGYVGWFTTSRRRIVA